MQRVSFNSGWVGGTAGTQFEKVAGHDDRAPITLPHDAVRDLSRSPLAPDGPNNGYFPGGYFRYTKSFDVPDEYRQKTVLLEFEGVYRDAVVFVNGQYAAQRPYGYSRFTIDLGAYLRYGETNRIDVEARAHNDARWYTGAGIYRNTHLIVGDLVHFALDGLRVTTADVDGEAALIVIETSVINEERSTRTVRVAAEVQGPRGEIVARATAPMTILPGERAHGRFRLRVPEPALWDIDSPDLHRVSATLADDAVTIDSVSTTFGIRTMSLDPERGFRINGREVKLRGACIHHDNGLLGSATISRAEERRVEILKEAGFNAVRSSHNPLSVAMLDACDRLGMFVLDETFDVWTQPKTAFDYSLAFPEWWERDVESMVAKDFNHPSVVMYSIGNEIFETGSSIGATWGRLIANRIRELDPTRFVTNAINGFVSVSDELPDTLTMPSDNPTDVNFLIAAMSEKINELGASQLVSDRTEESHAVLDVSGLNYCDARYVPDRTAYPNRVILGTETFPSRIDELWRLVTDNTHVIGDFTWTGWDYVGETGVGRTDYPDGPYVPDFFAPFPALTADCADIDITGHRRPISYYREIVFGLREQPYIAVHRPEHYGRPVVQTPWSWSNSVSSWSWGVDPEAPVTIDVYSSSDEIELALDGEVLARQRVGEFTPFIARFDWVYQPGSLTAIAYREGSETGRTSLRTAGEVCSLGIASDRLTIRADDTDLAYVAIELRDTEGTLCTHRERTVRVKVEGPGILAGLGTGRTVTIERFGDDSCTTYDGRAMAIVRPTGIGEIRVLISTEDGLEASTVVSAQPVQH